MNVIANYILKGLSIICSIFLIQQFIYLCIGLFALVTNWDGVQNIIARNDGYALGQIIGASIFMPLLYSIVLLILAVLFWRWSDGAKSDISLYSKVKLALGSRWFS